MTDLSHIAEDLQDNAMPIEDLHLWDANPRQGDVDAVATSLKRFKQRAPVLYRRELVDGEQRNVVYAGNHRVKAATQLGWTHIAATCADDMTPDEVRAFAVADNRTSDLGSYDDELLAAQLAALDDSDMLAFVGYDDEDLATLLEAQDKADAERDSNYTQQIKAPIYEPTGKQPAETDLYDDSKTVELTAAIQEADLPPAVEEFLTAAAHRHTEFRFDLIAEWYAHAGPDLQALAEQSALVIIDFDQAIEGGFVQMSQAIALLHPDAAGPADE